MNQELHDGRLTGSRKKKLLGCGESSYGRGFLARAVAFGRGINNP